MENSPSRDNLFGYSWCGLNVIERDRKQELLFDKKKIQNKMQKHLINHGRVSTCYFYEPMVIG